MNSELAMYDSRKECRPWSSTSFTTKEKATCNIKHEVL